MKNIEKLVEFITKEFEAMTPQTINDVFISLQKHMKASPRDGGGNNYKEWHSQKAKRRRMGSTLKP